MPLMRGPLGSRKLDWAPLVVLRSTPQPVRCPQPLFSKRRPNASVGVVAQPSKQGSLAPPLPVTTARLQQPHAKAPATTKCGGRLCWPACGRVRSRNAGFNTGQYTCNRLLHRLSSEALVPACRTPHCGPICVRTHAAGPQTTWRSTTARQRSPLQPLPGCAQCTNFCSVPMWVV